MRQIKLQNLHDEVKRVICFDQPKLKVQTKDDSVFINGTYHLIARSPDLKAAGKIASYEISITLSDFPCRKEPIVKELGGKIPNNSDYHINKDGSCCICVWEAWVASVDKPTLQKYFSGPLYNFFLNQFQKEKTGNWPLGEEEHGFNGLLTAFSEVLDCPNNKRDIQCLLRVLSQDWPKGHWACPCKSGKIIRKCCKNSLQELHERIPKYKAKMMLKRLVLYFNAKQSNALQPRPRQLFTKG